jgi:hypothetical protein
VFSESRALVADLDCLPPLNVSDGPTGFEHDPRFGLRGVRQAALRYLYAVNEHENVIVSIPVNFTNRRFIVTHGSALDSIDFQRCRL